VSWGHFSRMPRDSTSQSLLLERMRMLERPPRLIEGRADSDLMVLFRLGDRERYGVLHGSISAILPPQLPTPVPCTPPFIAGVINHQGEIITVLDLKALLPLNPPGYRQLAPLLLIQDGSRISAIRIDELIGEQPVVPEKLVPLPNRRRGSHYIQGIHAGQIALLDIPALLNDSALQVNEQVT